MSSPGPALELLGQITYQFFLIRPYIPTYVHLIISALFPIYAGSHASLSRPSSAARISRRKKHPTKEQADHDDDAEEGTETSQRMEGLSPSDAILYPVLTGCMLAGLYFLIKWLKDPAILNKILNWYLSVFGVLSIAKLLSDCMNTIISYLLPSKYYDSGNIWEIQGKQRYASARVHEPGGKSAIKPRKAPLPGLASRLPLSDYIIDALWGTRSFLTQPLYIMDIYVYGLVPKTRVLVGPRGVTSFFMAMTAVLYFNLIDKPWWLTNLLGFSFSYSALQLMSPTTFWTGTLVLTSLFFYDIYFVFFTPLMITVATKLDIPVKLLFPRPPGANDDPNKKALSMLGLGDVVLPGIMIGLALRFDLYLFYLKKQKRQKLAVKEACDGQLDGIDHDVKVHTEQNVAKVDEEAHPTEEVIKATYRSATGGWGERFWLGSQAVSEGGSFPKTYFHASVVGYIVGMICTLGVMHVYHHGQPALLYLVPGVLCSLWGTALLRGDIKTMWEYTEAEEEETKKPEKNSRSKVLSESQKQSDDKDAKAAESPSSGEDSLANAQDDRVLDRRQQTRLALTNSKQAPSKAVGRRLLVFAISLPPASPSTVAAEVQQTAASKKGKSLEGDPSPALIDEPNAIDTPQCSDSSVHSTLLRRSSDIGDAAPAGKRPRLD